MNLIRKKSFAEWKFMSASEIRRIELVDEKKEQTIPVVHLWNENQAELYMKANIFKMKSARASYEKSSLCGKDEEQQPSKFAIKHINSLFCASYLITIVIALNLTAYIHYVSENRSREIQINVEKFVESELLKHKEYNNRNTEQQSFLGWVCIFLLLSVGGAPRNTKFSREGIFSPSTHNQITIMRELKSFKVQNNPLKFY